MRSAALLAFTLFFTELDPAQAQSPPLVVEGAWIMTPPPGAEDAAAYVTIRSTRDDRLLSVSCACAARAELHEMSMSGAMMSMRALRYGAPVSASTPIAMSPHGMHIMLTGLSASLSEGQTVPLRLNFREAGIISTNAIVRRR